MSWFSSGIKNIVGEERYNTISSLFTAGIAEKITGFEPLQPYFEQVEAQKLSEVKQNAFPYLLILVGIIYLFLRK